jgi:hypothetical protein
MMQLLGGNARACVGGCNVAVTSSDAGAGAPPACEAAAKSSRDACRTCAVVACNDDRAVARERCEVARKPRRATAEVVHVADGGGLRLPALAHAAGVTGFHAETPFGGTFLHPVQPRWT